MSSSGPEDDRQLLAAHLAGDPGAFDQLVTRYRGRLWAVALRTTGDREEALDALQDALFSAVRAAPGFRGESAVSTWLHRIVVNACLDRLRRRAARPSVPLPEESDTGSHRSSAPVTAAGAAAVEARLDLHAALARLPEAQRVAIVLVDLEDLPVAEAAELLGVAEGTVKSRCARGRLELARLLRPGYGPESAAGHGTGPGRRSGRRATGNPAATGGVPLVQDAPEGPGSPRPEEVGR